MSNLNLKRKKLFDEKVDKCWYTKFDVTTSQQIGKTLKQNNNCFVYIIMFYFNMKSLIFKVLGVVVYCFIKKYVCVDYLIIQREPNFSPPHKVFEDT